MPKTFLSNELSSKFWVCHIHFCWFKDGDHTSTTRQPNIIRFYMYLNTGETVTTREVKRRKKCEKKSENYVNDHSHRNTLNEDKSVLHYCNLQSLILGPRVSLSFDSEIYKDFSCVIPTWFQRLSGVRKFSLVNIVE